MKINRRLRWLFLWANYFESKIHMLVSISTDKNIIKKTNVNLNYAIKYLIQNNIDYEIHDMPKGNIAEQTLDFAQKINADLILIVTTKNITFADYVVGAFRTVYYCKQFQDSCVLCKSNVLLCQCRTIYGWLGIVK